MSGLEAARTRGGKGERKPMIDGGKIAHASKLMHDGEISVSAECAAMGVSSTSLNRCVESDGTPRGRKKG